MEDSEEKVKKLTEILPVYPKEKHRRHMMMDAVLRDEEGILRALIETGVGPHPPLVRNEEGRIVIWKRDMKSSNDKGQGDDSEVQAGEADEEGDTEEVESIGDEDEEDPICVPVIAAVNNNKFSFLKLLIEECHVDVNAVNEIGMTPLLAAASRGNADMVRCLLSLGADPRARVDGSNAVNKDYFGDHAGFNVLEKASTSGTLEVVRLILEHPIHGSTRKRRLHEGEEDNIMVTSNAICGPAGTLSVETLKFLLERSAYPMSDTPSGASKGSLLDPTQRETLEEALSHAATTGSLACLRLLLSYFYPTSADCQLVLPTSFPADDASPLRKPLVWGAYSAIQANVTAKFDFIYNLGLTEHETMSLDALPAGARFNMQSLWNARRARALSTA